MLQSDSDTANMKEKTVKKQFISRAMIKVMTAHETSYTINNELLKLIKEL